MFKSVEKNVLIPYEKYEKLMNSITTHNGDDDKLDGQCISHTQHFELNRDKNTEYGVDIDKNSEDPIKRKVAFSIQKGDGKIDLTGTEGFEETIETQNQPPPNDIGGPPGRRLKHRPPKKYNKNKKNRWTKF